MGCWNGTCGISNLPILNGEKVYCVLIAENPWPDKSMCHATDLYQPVGFYFQGTYDDYGSLEHCHGIFLEETVSWLRDCLVEVEQDPANKYIDRSVKREGFSVEQMFEDLHEGNLYLNNHLKHYGGKEKCKVYKYFIKEGIFEGIMQRFNPLEYDFTTKGAYSKKNYKPFDDIFIKSCQDYRLGFKEYAQVNRPSVKENFGELPRYISAGESNIFSGINFLGMRELFCKSAAPGMSDEKFGVIIQHLMYMVKLTYFMNMNRQIYAPTCGEGSQNTDLATHKLLNKLSNVEMKKIRNYYDA